MQQLQETFAPQANEAVATRSLHFTLNVAVNQVPVNEFIDDGFRADRIICGDVLNGLVREYDAPAEGIVGFIALVNFDFVVRVAQLHADAQVQARGSATHTNYLHVTLRSRSAPGLNVQLAVMS